MEVIALGAVVFGIAYAFTHRGSNRADTDGWQPVQATNASARIRLARFTPPTAPIAKPPIFRKLRRETPSQYFDCWPRIVSMRASGKKKGGTPDHRLSPWRAAETRVEGGFTVTWTL